MKSRIKTYAVFLIFSFYPLGTLFAQIRSDFVLVPFGAGPSLKFDTNNQIQATWLGENGDVYFGLFDSLYTEIQPPLRVSEYNFNASPRLSLIEEYTAVVWRRLLFTYNSNIVGQLITNTGDAVFTNMIFNDSYGDAERSCPDIIFLNDTLFFAIWAGSGTETPSPTTGVYGQLVSTRNAKIGTNKLLSDVHGDNIQHCSPRVAYNKVTSDIFIAWRDNRLGSNKVFGRLIFSDATAKDASFLISEDPELRDVWFLSTATTHEGNYTVVWGGKVSDRWTIQLRRLDKNGIPIGPSVRVNSNPDSVTSYPAVEIAYGKDGRSVVVWEQKVNGYSRIFAQRYLPDGSPFGESFRVSTIEDTLHQFFPSVALHHKKIYTAWGSGGKIWANIYDFNNLTVPVKDQTVQVGNTFQLLQNYPNPFNAGTTIRFMLTKAENVRLAIHNVLGQEIITVVNDTFMSGTHTVYWNGKDAKGNDLPSGIYLSRLIGEELKQVRKMLLLR